MKNFYSWLVMRAFKIKEAETTGSLELQRKKQNRNQKWIRNVAVFLALSSIVLLLITFFIPGLKAHYKFSRTYNTASILNTCSGCLLGICFLILITLVDSKMNKDIIATPGTENHTDAM